MNAIITIFRKDFRLFWQAATAWLLINVAAAGTAIHFIHFDLGNSDGSAFYEVGFLAYNLIGALFIFLIPLSLFREDPSSDPGAFWVTRPVAPWQVLGAKLLGIFAFAWLPPLLVGYSWWIWEGFSLGSLSELSLMVGAQLIGISILACAASVFVRRNSSVILIMLAVLVVLLAFGFLWQVFRSWGSNRPLFLTNGRVIPAFYVLVAGVVAAFLYERLVRRFWRSVLILGSTIGVSILVLYAWPWNFVMARIKHSGAQALPRIQIDALNYTKRDSSWKGTPVGLDISLKGFAADEYLDFIYASSDIDDNPGKRKENHRVNSPSYGPDAIAAFLRNGGQKTDRYSFEFLETPKLSLSRDELFGLRLKDEPTVIQLPRFGGFFLADIVRIRALANLPLVEGASASNGLGYASVDGVQILGKGFIQIDLSEVRTFFRLVKPHYFLVDPATDISVELVYPQSELSSLALGLVLHRGSYALELRQFKKEPFPSREAERRWLQSLRLVRLDVRNTQRIYREVSVPETQWTITPAGEKTKEWLRNKRAGLK